MRTHGLLPRLGELRPHWAGLSIVAKVAERSERPRRPTVRRRFGKNSDCRQGSLRTFQDEVGAPRPSGQIVASSLQIQATFPTSRNVSSSNRIHNSSNLRSGRSGAFETPPMAQPRTGFRANLGSVDRGGCEIDPRCSGNACLPIDVPQDGVGWRLQFFLTVRTSAPRPNSRPWGINAILARAAGRLSSSIATRTALAAGGLSSAVAARAAAPPLDCLWFRMRRLLHLLHCQRRLRHPRLRHLRRRHPPAPTHRN